MRTGAYISASLHVVAIALAYFGLPALFNPDPIPNQPVYVELVNLADQPVAKKSRPKPKFKPKPKPKAKLKPPPPPPPPKKAEPKAEPVPVAQPKPKPKPKAKAKPKPKPKPKPKKIAPKKPRVAKAKPKPKPKPRRKPKPPDPLKSLLRDIQKQPEKDVVRKKPKPKQDKLAKMLAAVAQPPAQKQSNMSPIDRRREAQALAQLVMRQVTPCWIIPAGAKDAHTIRVGVRIFLHPDGTLSGPPKIEDQARMSRDVAFRAVAESALRALRNPRCSPLRLPVRKYATWREISFNFDPRELLR